LDSIFSDEGLFGLGLISSFTSQRKTSSLNLLDSYVDGSIYVRMHVRMYVSTSESATISLLGHLLFVLGQLVPTENKLAKAVELLVVY
jgi:hypothetical protein